MCAVIGIKLENVDEQSLTMIRRIFIESRIRGLHATGVSYLKGGEIITHKEPISAERFIEKYDPSEWVEGNSITAIGHCRYSTSSLESNQPIANNIMSVVHNGVISQELPAFWEGLYGIKCETENDTELLFHRPDLDEWKDASISAIFLSKEGLTYDRNGKRPLWVSFVDNGVIVTSTEDIAVRSGIETAKRIEFEGKDLQP